MFQLLAKVRPMGLEAVVANANSKDEAMKIMKVQTAQFLGDDSEIEGNLWFVK